MGIHDGHRERLLSKFSSTGFTGLSEHEKLEIILFFSVPYRNTNDIAHELLNKYRSVANVMDAPEKELIKFKWIGKRTVQHFKLIKEAYSLYMIEQKNESSFLTTLDEFGSYFLIYFAAATEEKMVMMSLDSRGKRLGVDIIAEGNASSVVANSKKLILSAISRNATEVVLCHNHPGGLPEPSAADIIATKEIKNMLNNVGVYLKDHYIVTKNQYLSMSRYKSTMELFKEKDKEEEK